MTLRKTVKAGVGVAVLGGTMFVVGGNAFATQDAPKVTICHRTASQTNPYVTITVARASVDGDKSNDRGRGDHYMEHRGPVGPIASGEWGDIIPPIPGVHGGLNWDAAGIAAYYAGCGPVVTEVESTTTVPQSTTSVPETTTTLDPSDGGIYVA